MGRILESMELYSCAVCGETMPGMQWEEYTGGEKEYKCPCCKADLNRDELYGEED